MVSSHNYFYTVAVVGWSGKMGRQVKLRTKRALVKELDAYLTTLSEGLHQLRMDGKATSYSAGAAEVARHIDEIVSTYK
jgi:hypothetical protein